MMTKATKIFYNGPVITVNGRNERAEAIALCGDRILSVGSEAAVMAYREPATELVDLDGRTVIPGFYDPHSHMVYYARFGKAVDLMSYPHRPVKTIDDAVSVLKKNLDKVYKGWLNGWNCYDLLDAEGTSRFPNRDDLDKVSPDIPIVVQHESFHKCAMNSAALKIYGISDMTPDPEGGFYGRVPGTSIPDGILYETAAVEVFTGPVKESLPLNGETIREASRLYASKGITTACEGVAELKMMPALYEAEASGDLLIRLKLQFRQMAGDKPFPEYVKEIRELSEQLERHGGKVSVSAVKLFQDGSIQVGTAYLSEPYLNRPDSFGVANQSLEELKEKIRLVHDEGLTAQIHCIGDKAISEVIDAIAAAQEASPRLDPRHILTHALLITDKDLRRVKEYGIIPALYPQHIWFYGDAHRDIYLGEARAARISPQRSAERLGLPFTIHDDAPSFPIDALMTIHCAVNRVTESGRVLGPEERISAYEALKAITLRGAYQYHEEMLTGSLEVGKRADLAILEDDLTTCDPMRIKDIAVSETICGGETVYRK